MVTTVKRNGAFVIELTNAIGGESTNAITELTLRPANLDIADRWSKGKIQSIIGLLSVLTGVSEKDLVRMEYPDVDRVMTIMAIALPEGIRASIQNGERPLTTPKDENAFDEQATDQQPGDDAVNSLFPQTTEPVVQWPSDKPPPAPDDQSGFSTAPSSAMRKVG